MSLLVSHKHVAMNVLVSACAINLAVIASLMTMVTHTKC